MSGTPSWPRVLGSCYPPCPERFIAICNEEFGPAKSLGGYVFRDGPYRRFTQSEAAKWRAIYYGVEDHTGEPMVFTVCPWCGGELKPPADDEGLEADDGC